MKKTLKTVFAAVLAFTLLFCVFVPAFAFNEGDTVEWCHCSYDDVDFYTYAGVITEGENEFILSSRYNCFTADFEKPGFYLFSFNNELIDSVVVSEKVHDGAPCGNVNVLHAEEDGKVLAYIPDEETYIGFCMMSELSVVNVEISYYDYEISDVVFEDGVFENLMFGSDFRFNADKTEITLWSNFEVVFENGEKYFTDYSWLDFVLNGEIVYGENKVTFVFGNYSEDVTITVCYAMNYIRNIEITNLEKYLHSVRYYDGTLESDFEHGSLENEGVTITFWDGTVKTIEKFDDYDMIELPNGRYYEMHIFEIDNGDSVSFAFEIAGQILLSRECELENAGIGKNIAHLKQNIQRQTKWIVYEIESFFNALANPHNEMTASEIAGWISCIRDTVETRMGYVREEISKFCEYYGF